MLQFYPNSPLPNWFRIGTYIDLLHALEAFTIIDIFELQIELKAASNEISTKDYRIAELKEELEIRIANYNKVKDSEAL